MTSEVDLDAYFQRIGYSGSRSATLDTLAAIHSRHAQTIPFENINPLLGWPVRLDPQSLQRKLVRDKRGGYCFEHNLLLSGVLQQLGFQVTWLAARVLWSVPEDAETARSHMLLMIDIDGRSYVADVGFGGLTLTAPLRLQSQIEQRTPHEVFRLSSLDDSFLMEAKIGDTWKSLYRFDLQAQLLIDYEVTNWYLSTYPSSPFVTNLIAARPGIDCRYALRNNELVFHYIDGRTERRLLTQVAELRETLAQAIGLSLPETPELSAVLQRVTASVM
jgi:N-hydroxyarylamine O-acetyltransferase